MNRQMVLGLAVGCLLAASSAVRADAIPTSYQWGYRFLGDDNASQPVINHGTIGEVWLPHNAGYGVMHTNAGSPVQISTPIDAWSNAAASNPQTVSNMPFAINLLLYDKASGIKEYMSFGGVLNGNIWHGASTLSPTFLSPLTQTLNIDHHLYTVSFAGFTAPQGLAQPGSFRFNVTVHHNPEPSSLVLAGIGVPLFGFLLRRRQRAAGAAA